MDKRIKYRVMGYMMVVAGCAFILHFSRPAFKGSGLPFTKPQEYRVLKKTEKVVPQNSVHQALQETEFLLRRKQRILILPALIMLVGAILIDFGSKRAGDSGSLKKDH